MKKSASGRLISSTFALALLLIALHLAEAKHVSAQDLDNVTISGRVSDPNGGTIPGAVIEAVRVKTGATRATLTNEEGSYRLIQLEPGIYNLRASFSGFAPQEKKELSFIAGKNVQLDLTLIPQGVTVDPVLVT